MIPDFISQLDEAAPLTGVHPGLIALFDYLLTCGKITDITQIDALVQARSRVDIALKSL